MVALTQDNIERVYFHLGIGSRAGVDAGDLAAIQEAVTEIPSDFIKQKVLDQLGFCDEAYEARRLIETSTTRYTTKEQYSGDINRAVLREAAREIDIWRQNYLHEVDELAQLLWVPNYRMPGMDRYRWTRQAGAFIQSIPGPNDTSIASNLQQWWDLGGGYGIHKGFIRDDSDDPSEDAFILNYTDTAPTTHGNEAGIWFDENEERAKIRLQNDGDSINLTLTEEEIINISNFYG